MRWRLAALAMALGSALSFNAAQGYVIDIGYVVDSTGPASYVLPAGYTVFYVCSDRKPYQGDEKCPGDYKWVVRAANKDLYRKR